MATKMMTAVTQEEINAYLKNVEKELRISCNRNETRTYIGMLQKDINGYLKKYPLSTIDDVQQYFGHADDIRDSFIRESEPEVIARKIRFGDSVRKAVSLIIILYMLIIGFMVVLIIKTHINVNESIAVYDIEVIE